MTAKFHVFRATIPYEGRPYCGPDSHLKVAEYSTEEQAMFDAEIFAARSGVGWRVYDSETGECIYSTPDET